jgi:hypothetical protein
MGRRTDMDVVEKIASEESNQNFSLFQTVDYVLHQLCCSTYYSFLDFILASL